MMNTEKLDACISEIATILETTKEEVIAFVECNFIKYFDLKYYAKQFKTWPDEHEIYFISNYGIDHFLNLKNIEA